MEIEKENTIEIGRTYNGFLLKNWKYEDDDEHGNKRYISDIQLFEFNSDDEEKEQLIKLFYTIAEHFGKSYDKYRKDNLNINFDKEGHKVEDET